MPNMSNQELVRAFNINLRFNGIAVANFTVQNLYGKDHIVISFDKNMGSKQCMKYLSDLKEKIVKASYKTKKVAGMPYNLQSFPFTFHKERLDKDDKGRKRFSVVIDEGVVFNLKCYLAKALARDIKEKIGSEFGVKYARERVYDVDFDRNSYLYSMYFDDQRLQKYFIDSFSADIGGYENAPSGYLEVRGNYVHIKKSIFDNVEFIKDIAAYNASLECRYLQTPSTKNKAVDKLKHTVIDFMDRAADVPVRTIIRTSHNGSNENSVLIPLVNQIKKDSRLLDDNDAYKINSAFNMEILSDVSESISVRLPKSDSSDGIIYGIDFADVDIAYCVLSKIIESSVINKDHELSIYPELPRTLLAEASPTQWESPTRSQDEALNDSPRRGSEKLLLHNHVNSAGTSKGFSPRSHLSSPVTNPHSSKCVGAAQTVPAGTSAWTQPIGFWSSPAPSAEPSLWQPSRPSSWKGASESGSAWTSQPIDSWSSPASSAGLWSLSQSEPSSSRGAGKNMLTGSSPWCLPPSTSSLTTRNDSISSTLGIFADPPEDTENICSMKEKQQVTKEKEEEKLSKALLYTLNLMNYTLDGVYTNFFAKDGKIVSLLHDNVDREKYLQAVRDYIIKEYYETEKEARESCDFNEFPFKFLPDPDYEKNQNDCEEKQGKTVVANISSGALSNLKILFSQKFGKNVDAIDINWVKKVEEREKNEWVDRQLKDSLEEACEGCFSDEEAIEEACQDCFPDEGAMKIIPIAFEGGKYVLDRSRDTCEVNLLFKEQLRRFRGTSLEKRKSSDKPLTEEEKNLFKELLYAFNYSNNNFDLPDTNFIVKNGKIASLIPDSVDVKEYLEEVKKKTKEEYCKDKKEAYDLDEFPFEFLSNCEKNQETTVVANISRAALFNLEKLFIYGYEEKVKIEKIDINIIKEAVKSKKDRLIDLKVKKGIEREGGYYNRIKHREAATACYPDENALEGIPIIKDKGGYCLDRTFYNWETESLLEELGCTKGTSKAEEMKPEDNKDSGISSGEATDAENVSSKAEATTSGYESMDCENTRGGSPKRTLELSVENLRISTQLGTTNIEQLCSPAKKPKTCCKR